MALLAALTDRRKSVVAANALYGATISMLMNVLRAAGRRGRLSSMSAIWTRCGRAVAEAKPGCILMETISNPLLRVGEIDRIAEMARAGRRRADRRQHLRHAAAGAAARTRRQHRRSTASPSTWPATATCWAAWSSPTQEHYETLRSAVAHHRPGAGPVRKLSDDARHQDVRAAHGAAVRQCLPRRDLAGRPSQGRARLLPRRSGASRCRHHPAPLSRRASTARWSASN